MKTTITIIITFLLIGCKWVDPPKTGVFSIDSKTYTSFGTVTNNGDYLFGIYFNSNPSHDNNEGYIKISFKQKLTKTGAYKVVSTIPKDTSSSYIFLVIDSIHNYTSPNHTYTSVGQIGDSIHVIIDSGKVKINLANITMRKDSSSYNTTITGAFIVQ